MAEEGNGGRGDSSVSSFTPVRYLRLLATPVIRIFDWGISNLLCLKLYIYRFVAGQYPVFLEEKLKKIKNLEDYVDRLEKEKKNLVREKEEALRRLSEVVSVRLRDNNPNIADLNDQCRPTKLAEMFSELYDNEWTAAYSVLEAKLNETSAVKVLLKIIMQAYDVSEKAVAGPWNVVTKWFLDMNLPGSQQTSKWLKDSRKLNIRSKLPDVLDEFKKCLMKMFHEEKVADLLADDNVNKYLEKCVELSLLMVTTDPPVVIVCPRLENIYDDIENVEDQLPSIGKANSSVKDEKNEDVLVVMNETIGSKKEGTVFNKELFKEYTRRGKYIDYIVWPALLLHSDGPLLGKGVAQGKDEVI